MKVIPLMNGGSVSIPEDWTEVPLRHREKGFEWLAQVMYGQMTRFDWQVRMLFLLTDYKPSRRTRRRLQQGKPIEELTFNLIRLAELLSFPFEIVPGEAEEPERFRISRDMADAPFPCSTYFRRKDFIETNLTAGQYCDLVEMLTALQQPDLSGEAATNLMHKLAETVGYDSESISFAILLALTMWAEGIVEFFQQHPTYGVLYQAKGERLKAKGEEINPSTLTLSPLKEIMMELTERGYKDVRQMPIEDFMDAQLKMLRDNLRKALAEGVKREELAARTGINLEELGL